MYHQRPKKENNECQTDLQCTPFILNENETAKVQSSRLCQTEIQLSPRAPDTELYKIIPFIDEDDIERNAVRLVNITRNRKIKLQFVLPIQESNLLPPSLEDDNDKYIVTDGVNKEVAIIQKNENLNQCFSNESFHKTENQRHQSEDAESVSSIGTLKSAIKKILREDDSTQTDLMIAPHVLNDKEKAIITIHNSCQTSVTCSPRTSLTDVVPMLKSYWAHQGETREAFNKSENVLEILKEIIQDVINIHQHMFDPNYNLPDMNTVLVKLGPKNSSLDSSEWDTISPSKTTKKTLMDVSGDGSFENATLSELDSSFNNKFKDDTNYNQSAIASISTISEVTTLRSSDFTLTSTKDGDDDDIEVDDEMEGISDILERLKKKYTNNGEDEDLSNVKSIHSEPIISSRTEATTVTKVMSDTNNSAKRESSVELFGSELWSENDSSHKEITVEDTKKEPHKCQMINSNCVCSGIKIKLYLKDKLDETKGSTDRFIEMKIKPDLDSVEIKKLLSISTDPELAEISSTIPFQEIENCLKDETDDSAENLAKFFDIEDPDELFKADICKSDGFQIKINIPKSSALCPQTTSEEFLQSFLLTNFLLKDIENTPFPEMLNKVPFPSRTCGNTNADDDNAAKIKLCSCDKKTDEKSEIPKYQKTVNETLSPFTEVFSRLYEDPDNLIPFDTNDLFCECKHGENDVVACDTEPERLPIKKELDIVGGVCNPANEEYNPRKSADFDKNNSKMVSNYSDENRMLKNMSSYVILPSRQARAHTYAESYNDAMFKKPGIVITRDRYDTNSITYDGRVYQTDSFFIPGGSDGSDDSSGSNIIDKTMHHKSRKQTYTISYEEHMYKADGEIVPPHSETSMMDLDCICDLKLEQSLRECPHCFRRIGPQYGRDQRGLNEDYDQSYDMKDPADYCSTKQGHNDPTRSGTYSKPYLASTSGRFISNYTVFPSNRKMVDSNLNELATFNTAENNNATYFIERTNKVQSESEPSTNFEEFNNLLEKNDTTGNDVTGKNTSENDTTKKNNITVIYTSNPETTNIEDSTYNLMGRTNNITGKNLSESAIARNINSSNNLNERNNITEKYTSESDKTKNEDSSNNLIGRNNIAEKYTSESGTINSSNILMEKSDTTQNLDAFNNLIDSTDISSKTSGQNVGISKESRTNEDNTGLLKYVEFTEKVYPTGKIVIGKINDTTKLQDAGSNSKCNICYRNKPCPKILCDIEGVVRHPENYECTKSADGETSSFTKIIANEDTSSLAKIIADKETSSFAKITTDKDTSFAKKIVEKNATLHQNLSKEQLEVTSSLDKIIADMQQKYTVKSKTKCQTCSKAKLNKTSNKNSTIELDTPSLDKIIADMEETYKATSKTKCKTCSKAKLNQTLDKNLKMVTVERICSICSSKDGLVEKIQMIKESDVCSAICNKGNGKSGIELEEKRSVENLQKLTQMAENLDTQQNKTLRKKCLSCSNLTNKDSRISSSLNHQENSSKSPSAPKTKCSTCKKALKPANTIQVIYSPKSKSLNCTCIKSKCRQTENMEETICLKKESTQDSVKNKCLTCKRNKEKSIQYICSKILHNQLKKRLENILEIQCKQSNVECPAPPCNSLLSNCKCNKCIFSENLNEVDNISSGPPSKCQNLPNSSIQKIFERNLPCSCSSSSTNQKSDNSGHNLDYLAKKINPCFAKCNQSKDTSKDTIKNSTDKQETPIFSEQLIPASSSGLKLEQNFTENKTRLKEKELIISDEIDIKDLLSTFSVTTQPRVRILDTPKYIYKSYNSISNGGFVLDSNENKEIFLYNSLDDLNNVEEKNNKNVEFAHDEFLLSNVSQSDTHDINEENGSKTPQVKSKKSVKTMKVHKLDGKYSVFSIEKKTETGGSQTTVYILPNAIFSSLLSIPPPQFLRERTESEIDDIIQFSHVRNLHYEKNPLFDQETNATTNSTHNSEQFINIIANQNLPNLNCETTCSCSSSVPKSKEQQTDKIFDKIKADKATSITSLEKGENKIYPEQSNSVGIQSSYVLFHTIPHSEKTSFSSILKPSYKKKKFLNDDNEKLLEDTLENVEPNPMQIMSKYITWKDLVNTNLYKPIPIQKAITSLEPFINYENQKVNRSIQTSNISFINELAEPSTAPPLTIEASTSTGNLENEASFITSAGYHLSENFSTIDSPLHYPNTSDYSISEKNKTLQKHIFQTPSATKNLKRTIFPILTLEASTSTTSRNQEMEQTEESPKSSLRNTSLDKNLIEEETTSMSKYAAYIKASTLEFPTNKTSSSISLTRISSPFKNTPLERSSLTPKASPSKVQNIGFSSTTSANIASPFINSIQEALPVTHDMSPTISLTKFALSNISVLQEPNLPKLTNVESYSQIILPEDQISCVSLPKVESVDSIPESNNDPTDTIANFDKRDLNLQEWTYPQERQRFPHSKKFMHKTNTPSEFFIPSKENASISLNSKHGDISILKNNLPVQNEALLNPELEEENNEPVRDLIISDSFNSADLKSKDMVDDKNVDTKLLSNITTRKLNTSESNNFISNINDILSGNAKPNEENRKLKSSKFEKYHNLGLKQNTKLEDSPFDASNTNILQRDAGSIPQENIHKNLQLENLLSRAIDAYTAYLTLKKGISSNFNVSKIDLPHQNTDISSKYTKDDEKDFLLKYQPIKEGSREFLTDSVTSKTEDYYSAYLKRKDRISSLISIAKMDSSGNYSNNNKEKDKNSLELSDINVDSHHIHNSRDDFLSKTEQAYSKLLQRKDVPPKISISNIYSSFENISKELETNPAKNSLNYQYSSLSSEASTINDFKPNNFTSKNKRQDAEISPLPYILEKDSSYQTISSKPNIYKDLRSDKFILKKVDDNSDSLKCEEEISSLSRDLQNSIDQKIKTEKDNNSIESEYSEILKRKQSMYPKVYRNSNQRLFSFKNEDSYLRRSKQEKNDSLSTLSSIKNKNLPHNSLASGVNFYKEVILNKINLNKKDDHDLVNKKEIGTNLIKINSPNHSVRPNTSKDLKSEKFIYNTKRNYSTYTVQEEEFTPDQQSINRSSKDIKSNDYSTYAKKEDFTPPRKSTSIIAPTNLYSISENRSSRDFKSNDYSTYPKKEENISTRRSTPQSASPYSHNIVESKNYKNLISNDYSTYPNKEEPITPRRSTLQSTSPYQHSTENRNSRHLKPNEYSTYPKKGETISPRRSVPQSASPYPHYVSENKSSRNLKTNEYSTYPKKEEPIPPRRSVPQNDSPYPHSGPENRNSRDEKSNKFIYNPENRENVSSSRNLKTDLLNPVNNNSANNKNSATSKLSSFVRNGATSALLGNIGDSTQQLSMEEIDNILPEIAVSSHRVLEAVQSCEQRLQPIKNALKDIKMKLKELNMPEVNGIFQDDHLIDENNKTYIYLPPPPPPLVGNRCSYRTKMTFQLKKPIKPLSVTANVNPFSIKHKYILNDAEHNHGLSNTNYSSVSDPPYYIQRKSINSITPNFNQASRSENKPLHSQRHHPDTYFERSHTNRKPVEVIDEELPFPSEDLKGRQTMDEFDQYRYLPNSNEMYYYQPRTESLNNYVVFPPVVKSSRVYVPVTNSFYKTDEHVFKNNNVQNDMKMFTGDYPLWKSKPRK